MKLYRTTDGIFVEENAAFFRVEADSWDEVLNSFNLADRASAAAAGTAVALPDGVLPPVHLQEIWAAGVTYYRSRDARMEESQAAGGGDFYDRVYAARAPGTLLQERGLARCRSRRHRAHSHRRNVVHPRAGADAGGQHAAAR